jgi:hypothetical protein
MTMPQIAIAPVATAPLPADGLGAIVALLVRHRGAHGGPGDLISALVREGRRFRQTDSGRRWRSLLAESKLVENGWMVWNLLDLDRYITARDLDADGDTPSAMIEDVLHDLAASRIETMRIVLDAIAVEMEAANVG